MTKQSNSNATHRIAEMLASTLNSAFADVLTTPPSLRVVGESDERLLGTTRSVRLTFDGALHGECALEFNESQVAKFAAKGIDESSNAAGEYNELIRTIMETVRERLIASLSSNGEQVSVELDLEPGSNCEGETTISLVASETEQPVFQVLLHFDSNLSKDEHSLNPALSGVESAGSQFGTTNLELVMDVELSISLRFGTCKMPLSDVLELTGGSIVELDRRVEDPVELVLGGKVIARGEAVVVDGNYGLRVTEVSGIGLHTFERALATGSQL